MKQRTISTTLALLGLLATGAACSKKKEGEAGKPVAAAGVEAQAAAAQPAAAAAAQPAAAAAAAAQPAAAAPQAAAPAPAAQSASSPPEQPRPSDTASSIPADRMTACRTVMAAAVKCRSDKKYVGELRKHFGWPKKFHDALAQTDESSCEMFLEPGKYLDADDNTRIAGADLTDKAVLDALVVAAGKGCGALAAEFNKETTPGGGVAGFPYEGAEAH